jgi:hypothetical protein
MNPTHDPAQARLGALAALSRPQPAPAAPPRLPVILSQISRNALVRQEARDKRMASEFLAGG